MCRAPCSDIGVVSEIQSQAVETPNMLALNKKNNNIFFYVLGISIRNEIDNTRNGPVIYGIYSHGP